MGWTMGWTTFWPNLRVGLRAAQTLQMPRWNDLLQRFVIGLDATNPSALLRAPASELSALLPHTFPIAGWRGRSVEERQLTLYKGDDYLRLHYPQSLIDGDHGFQTTIGITHWLEDMDTFAADVAALYCLRGKPNTLVTAMLETLVWLGARSDASGAEGAGAQMSGQVSWVGKSSIQVTVELTLAPRYGQEPASPSLPPVAIATFLMASRSLDLSSSVAVDMIKMETESQRKRFEIGSGIAAMRKERRQGSFSSLTEASSSTSGNELLVMTSPITTDCDRNTSGSTFGGHLIKLAFEHGIKVVQAHTNERGKSVRLRAIEEASFLALVPIGSSLLMKGCMVEVMKLAEGASEIKVHVSGHLSSSVKALDFFFWFEISS
jgi:acyl-CoA hydrolase